jgi:hypothetical protein
MRRHQARQADHGARDRPRVLQILDAEEWTDYREVHRQQDDGG